MKRIINIAALLLLLSVPVRAVQVKDVNVKGLTDTDRDFILSVCHCVEGSEFSLIRMRQDIAAMYELGYFDDINVDVADSPEGIIINYVFSERPFIRSVDVKGNKKFDEYEILYEVPFLIEDVPFDKKYLHQAKYFIEKKYREEGYFQVSVNSYAKDFDGGKAIYIEIDEGSKLSVGRIIFKGLEGLNPKKLKKGLETKESSWWKHPKLDQGKIREDLRTIEKKLWDMGYFGASVTGFEIVESEMPGKRDVVIDIVQGRKYTVGQIVFKGNALFTAEELNAAAKIYPGADFTGEDHDKTVTALLEMYGNKSHIFADVDTSYEFDGDNVDVTFNISEGSPIIVGEIRITGNTKTVDKVILRNVFLYPGDEFKRDLLILTQEQIYNLGYFEDVRVLPMPDRDNPNVLNITIDVKEKMTGSINFGGSYSDYAGFSLFLKYEEQNVFGRAYKGSVQLELGKKVETYQLAFTNPNIFDTNIYLSGSVYKKNQNYTDYKIKRDGGGLTIGKKLTVFTTGFLSYTIENVEVSDISEEAADAIDESKEIRSSMSLTFARDSRDNRFEPSRGTNNSITGELGGEFLGGDINYYKVEASSNWFFKSFWKFVFSTYFKAGLVEKLDPSEEVPIYERFFVGGNIYGVRGYEDKELSPYNDEGYYEGGNFYFTSSFSYKFPLVERMITGYVFWDVGRAWTSLGDFNFRDLRDGAGLGVKITTPMGPITLDYAYGFDKEDWKFHFGISQGTF